MTQNPSRGILGLLVSVIVFWGHVSTHFPHWSHFMPLKINLACWAPPSSSVKKSTFNASLGHISAHLGESPQVSQWIMLLGCTFIAFEGHIPSQASHLIQSSVLKIIILKPLFYSKFKGPNLLTVFSNSSIVFWNFSPSEADTHSNLNLSFSIPNSSTMSWTINALLFHL